MTEEDSLSQAFREKVAGLKKRRDKQLLEKKDSKLSIAILGAGPAGLIHAIVLLLNGYKPKVIEKRTKNCKSRMHAIVLKDKALELLQEYGVYAYLEANNLLLFSQEQKMCVGIADLEKGLKSVIAELEEEQVIHYEMQLSKIIQHPESRVDLQLQSQDGQTHLFTGVDLIINCEGSHSKTNELLGNRRIDVLPRIPVVSVIFESEERAGRALRTFVRTVYYYTLFILKFISFAMFLNPKRHIAAVNLFKINTHYFLGYCLSEKESEKLENLLEMEEENRSESEGKIAFVKRWAYFCFCYSSFRSLFRWLFYRGRSPAFFYACHPIKKITTLNIGADHAETYSYRFGRCLLLIVGDALATVDPSTEMGCQTAIESAQYFESFLKRFEEAVSATSPSQAIAMIQQEYDAHWKPIVEQLSVLSVTSRQTYREDAI